LTRIVIPTEAEGSVYKNIVKRFRFKKPPRARQRGQIKPPMLFFSIGGSLLLLFILCLNPFNPR
jgi:hypothetical protein